MLTICVLKCFRRLSFRRGRFLHLSLGGRLLVLLGRRLCLNIGLQVLVVLVVGERVRVDRLVVGLREGRDHGGRVGARVGRGRRVVGVGVRVRVVVGCGDCGCCRGGRRRHRRLVVVVGLVGLLVRVRVRVMVLVVLVVVLLLLVEGGGGRRHGRVVLELVVGVCGGGCVRVRVGVVRVHQARGLGNARRATWGLAPQLLVVRHQLAATSRLVAGPTRRLYARWPAHRVSPAGHAPLH